MTNKKHSTTAQRVDSANNTSNIPRYYPEEALHNSFFSEQDLMTMLSHLNFGVLPESWKNRQQNPQCVPTEAQRIDKIKNQLSELMNHYAFEKMLAPLGQWLLPVCKLGYTPCLVTP